MRLLNTETVELHDFSTGWRPQYAILSHRWEEEEVSFDDALHGKNIEKAGWLKIKALCKLVERYYDWVWIDTCRCKRQKQQRRTFRSNQLHARVVLPG